MARQSLVRVEIDKLSMRRLDAKLHGKTLFGDDLRQILKESVEEGAIRVQSRVPVGQTHALHGSIATSIDPQPLPLWAKITADASRAGFRYGRALQASKKIVYRYRNGPRTGRPTRRWFSGTRPWIRKRLEARLARMARRVESRWRRP